MMNLTLQKHLKRRKINKLRTMVRAFNINRLNSSLKTKK